MEGKRVLITGGNGFIGACLAREMADKCDVHLILRGSSGLWRLEDIIGKLSVHRVDITDRNALAETVKSVRPQVIYHLAAYGAAHGQAQPKEMIDTNIYGTVNLVDACSETGFESFVNIGSSSEYGVKESPMKEGDRTEPDSLYGITKAAATHYCEHIARSRGLPMTTFRVFAAYGPYQPKGWLIPSLITAALRNEPARLASPSSVRDFIFVEDIIEAIMLAPQKERCHGETLNLGTGNQHTVAEVADIVGRLCGTGVEPEWGAKESRHNEPKAWVADMSKTMRLLGWKPKHDLESGLKKDIEWFRKNISYYG